MRNGRAPTARAPNVGWVRAGPKSGLRPFWPISSRRPSYWPRRTSARRTRSERVERDDVDRTDPRVLAPVRVHVDQLDRRRNQTLERLGDRAMLAGKREDR